MQDDDGSPSRGSAHAGAGAPQIVPLFERLPHGPHRMERREVLLHQRSRIHRAMVEAVARSGYGGTSVKQITGLAGVSRRAFYEQFANREDCFLSTFDRIADLSIQRLRRLYLSVDGPPEECLRAVFEECARAFGEEPKAMALVSAEAQTVGRNGIARLRAATATCEQLLARSLSAPAGSASIPTPIARGVAGGLLGPVCFAVRAAPGRRPEPDQLGEALLEWTLPFVGAVTAGLAERMAANVSQRLGEVPAAGDSRADGRADGEQRERMLHSALRLAVLGEYLQVTPPQIAEEAGAAPEAFNELFAGTAECYLEALDLVAERLLAVVSDRALNDQDWPVAVRSVLAALLRHLAANPLHAHTVAQGAFTAGVSAVERNLELARSVAAVLTTSAPAGRTRALAVEAVAGAVWHVVGCQAAGGRIQLLPVLSDYLTFVVLTPFIGAHEAADTVMGAPPVSGVCS